MFVFQIVVGLEELLVEVLEDISNLIPFGDIPHLKCNSLLVLFVAKFQIGTGQLVGMVIVVHYLEEIVIIGFLLVGFFLLEVMVIEKIRLLLDWHLIGFGLEEIVHFKLIRKIGLFVRVLNFNVIFILEGTFVLNFLILWFVIFHIGKIKHIVLLILFLVLFTHIDDVKNDAFPEIWLIGLVRDQPM